MRNKFGGVKVGKNTQYAAIKEGKDAVDELVNKYSVQLSGAPNFPEGFLSERSKSPSAEDEALLRIYIEETIESIKSEKYRAVLHRYFETMNANQVADELGVSKDTVYDAINKFKEKYVGSD
jgi:DNA-directed RNA polymerase specialized sigma24 family protein